MFRGKNKDIRMTSASGVSLVDFEQVNVCWNVIKSLRNYFWPILKMLCSKCCLHSSNFYWHNALMYSLKKMQVTLLRITFSFTFTFSVLKQSLAGNMIWRQVKQEWQE